MVVGLALFGQVQREDILGAKMDQERGGQRKDLRLGLLRRCFQPGLPSREHWEWKGRVARRSGAQH